MLAVSHYLQHAVHGLATWISERDEGGPWVMRRTQSTPLSSGGSDAIAHGWAGGSGHGGGGGGGKGPACLGGNPQPCQNLAFNGAAGCPRGTHGVGFPGHSKNQPGYLRNAAAWRNCWQSAKYCEPAPLTRLMHATLRCKHEMPDVCIYKISMGIK